MCSILAVKYFGRRTLVIWGHLAIAAAHFGVAYSIGKESDFGSIGFILVFLIVYQCSSGPVAWLYAAETTIEAALGLCVFVLWGTVFLLSLICPILFQDSVLG